MNTEEKARRYDEALNWMRAIYPGLHGATKEDAEHFFPELKESDSERIRKALYKVISDIAGGWPFERHDITKKDALAYLEKQKINTEGDFGRGYDCGYQAGYAIAMNEMKSKVATSTLDSEKQKEPLPIPDKFSGLKSLMLQYLQSAANRKDDTEIERDTDLWGRKILDYVWKYSDEQKEQKPLTTEETELNSIAFLEQMGYTCILPGKEQKPVEWKPQPESLEALMYAIEGKWDAISPTSYLSRRLEDLYEGLVNTYNVDESLLSELPEAASRAYTAEDIEGLRELKRKIEASMEQKPVEKQDYSGLNDLERAIHRGFLAAGVENVPITIIKETAKECLAQIKTAEWDEEDREIAQNIMVFLKEPTTAELCPQLRKECQDWLKSLPERFNLQPKEEWSEEDKQYFDDLIVGFEKSLKINRCYFTSYDVDWLKSKFNGNSCK